MEKEGFTAGSPGQLVSIPHDTPDVEYAFVPNPLPPAWQWPGSLWPLLSEAKMALASLDGTGKYLPNPEIVLRPIQQREARLSSELEGTFTDPQKQALFQADPRYPTSPTDATNPYREIFNYGMALRLRLDKNDPANQVPLSNHLIRELHQVLMHGVRSHQQRPGKFRSVQNQTGHPARFVPPPPEHLASLLEQFEDYLQNRRDDFDPLVQAFLAHYQFETIHPFDDGNGRVGRLLLALTIAEWCQLSNQWLYMSAFFERSKKEYMDLLLRVSTHGDWERWIRFCLKGVISQARDTERRCEKLINLHRDFHQRLTGGTVRLATIVDGLFETPAITVLAAKRALNVTYPTARADLRKLEGLGILQLLEGMPRISYYCAPIYEVMYEDIEPLR